ncbi:hypothetical protein TNCV_919511 [Trichonephila clavipes]|nr:hypothetical protein TNCV_919511 [Trichonephila clavipes]
MSLMDCAATHEPYVTNWGNGKTICVCMNSSTTFAAAWALSSETIAAATLDDVSQTGASLSSLDCSDDEHEFESMRIPTQDDEEEGPEVSETECDRELKTISKSRAIEVSSRPKLTGIVRGKAFLHVLRRRRIGCPDSRKRTL